MIVDKENEAGQLYQEAKKFNWRDRPGDAALAFPLFAAAASLGHNEAKLAMAGMMFVGSGAPKEQAKAMGIVWQSFAPAGVGPLEELGELLHSYAETIVDSNEKQRALNAAVKAEQAFELLHYVGSYVMELIRLRDAKQHRAEE